MLDETCRQLDARCPPLLTYREDDRTNLHATCCCLCADELRPGEAVFASVDGETIQWMCGPGRWARP